MSIDIGLPTITSPISPIFNLSHHSKLPTDMLNDAVMMIGCDDNSFNPWETSNYISFICTVYLLFTVLFVQ